MLNIAALARPAPEPPLSEILADAARALELLLRDVVLGSGTASGRRRLERELAGLAALLRRSSASAARLEHEERRAAPGRLRLLFARAALLIGWSIPA